MKDLNSSKAHPPSKPTLKPKQIIYKWQPKTAVLTNFKYLQLG